MRVSTHDTILAFDFWAVAKSDLQDIAQWVVGHSVYLTGKEQLHEDLQKLTAKTQPEWPSFSAKSQHLQEADNAVFLHLHHLVTPSMLQHF